MKINKRILAILAKAAGADCVFPVESGGNAMIQHKGGWSDSAKAANLRAKE
jgi:hypothetical protein